MRYFVYILECADESFYTGITIDLKRRFNEHSSGKGAHYTASRKPLKIVYYERKKDRGLALKREAEIKRWPRTKKLALIHSGKNVV